MTAVRIDLWVLVVGVALPSACLLMISLVYCWRRRQAKRAQVSGDPGFNQQVLLEMVLQQTDLALNNIVDAVHEQRTQLLQVLETHKLSLPAGPTPLSATASGAADTDTADVISVTGMGTALPATSKQPVTAGSSLSAESKIKTPASAAVFDPYSQIPDYLKQGLEVAEVAARLDLPESAVELYISLRMPAKSSDSQKTA